MQSLTLTCSSLPILSVSFTKHSINQNTLETVIDGLKMSGKNDDLWGAMIYLHMLEEIMQPMLKTEEEGNVVNTSKDHPPFAYFYFFIFHSILIFQTRSGKLVHKKKINNDNNKKKNPSSNYKALGETDVTDEITFGWI